MASGRECLTGMDAKCLRAAAQRAGRVFLTKNLLPRPAGSGCGGGAASQCAGGWSGKGVAWGCSVFFPALKGHKRGCVKTKITVGFAGYFPELACRMAAGFCGERGNMVPRFAAAFGKCCQNQAGLWILRLDSVVAFLCYTHHACWEGERGKAGFAL